jgi:Putative 2OG-Fe(II) oxygenase
MKIDNIHPTVILVDNCPGDIFKLIRNEFEINFDKINLFLSSNTWGDLVTSTTPKCKCIIKELNLKNTENYITSLVNEYLKNSPVQLQNIDPILDTSWVNIYTKYGFQNEHIHGHNFISGCLYLDADNDTGNLIFVPTYSERYKSYAVYEPETGKTLIFHGSVPHTVRFNSTDKKRISLSFNFSY